MVASIRHKAMGLMGDSMKPRDRKKRRVCSEMACTSTAAALRLPETWRVRPLRCGRETPV